MYYYLKFVVFVVSQLHLIVLSSIGLLRIRFGNGGWGWFISGIVFSAFIVFVDIVLLLNGRSIMDSFIRDFSSAVVFGPLFFFLTKRAIRRREERRAGQGGTPDGKA